MAARLTRSVLVAMCFVCVGGTPAAAQSDLLGSKRGGHYWFDFCTGKSDATLLPPDPRSLVTPTANKNVVFNVGWNSCMNRAPLTCGELRSTNAAGGRLLGGNGNPDAGWEFSGHSAWSLWSMSASQYNALWLRWGLPFRPSDFDNLVAERYGTPLSAQRNPYPLPFEDPNRTNGGSGQLPMALTQTRNPDGSWSGQIGVTCSVCHSGQIGKASDGAGLGALHGTNGLTDASLFLGELGGLNPAFTIASLNRIRGTGNITNFQLFALLTIFDPDGTIPGVILNPEIWAAGSTGTEDPPNWWNLGHRPVKFFDAGMSSDATRIELSWYMPGAALPNYEGGYDWILENEYEANTWMLGLKSPAYPLPVNTTLAQQGSLLFHTLDLWAANRNNPVVKPQQAGNGSCASCHGAYAPRYVNDPNFLANPLFEGMAANVTAINVIDTDEARLLANDGAVETQAKYSFFGYNGQDGCAEKYNMIGYLAQPLYGIWASGPYFHNGSVPDLWSLLKSSDRPRIWRRKSKSPRFGVVMGFETDLAKAYDQAKVGWKYDTIACSHLTFSPFNHCNPWDPNETPLIESGLSLLYGNGALAWNLLGSIVSPSLSNSDIEDRKIYNTRMFSQSNSGHTFTDVLTDAERTALIEYMKTL